MRYQKFNNGWACSNTGNKGVVFDNTLELRPVIYAVYSGPRSDRTTVQGTRPGDIVASVTWNSRGAQYELTRNNRPLSWGEEADIWPRLRNKHPWLDEYLEPQPRGETYLPREVIPEDEYLAVKAKRKRLAEFFKCMGLDEDPRDYMDSPGKGLRTKPRALDIDPDKIIPEFYSWDGSLVDIKRWEGWFASDGDGKPAIQLQFEPDVTAGSNWAHTETKHWDGKPGIQNWHAGKYLIRLRAGAYTRNHHSYGFKIDVWTTVA